MYTNLIAQIHGAAAATSQYLAHADSHNHSFGQLLRKQMQEVFPKIYPLATAMQIDGSAKARDIARDLLIGIDDLAEKLGHGVMVDVTSTNKAQAALKVAEHDLIETAREDLNG